MALYTRNGKQIIKLIPATKSAREQEKLLIEMLRRQEERIPTPPELKDRPVGPEAARREENLWVPKRRKRERP